MVVIKCNVGKCEFATSDLKGFLYHHGNHPESDGNKFVCNQENCHKDYGNLKNFRAHVKAHFATIRAENGIISFNITLMCSINTRQWFSKLIGVHSC